MVPHGLAVAGDEIVFARKEKTVLVLPRRGDQRNAAGQCLEHSDRRDAGQSLGIGPARDMHGHMGSSQGQRHAEVRQVPGEFDTGRGQRCPSFRRIAHAMDPRRETHRFRRSDQKLAELGGALLITPIADPHQIAVFSDLRMGMKQVQIGRLVPGEDLATPAVPPIGVAQHIAKREHAVEAVEIEGGDRLRVGDHPVMRVVEQQKITAAATAMRGDARDQGRLVPFMHQHDFGAIQRMIEIKPGRVVDGDGKIGIGLPPGIERRLALLCREIAGAPASGRFVTGYRDAAALALAQDAAQKMRVAMVPVRAQRMTKQHEAGHHATSR